MKSRSVFVLVPFWYEFLDSMFQKLRFNKDVNIELPYPSTYSVLVRGTGTEYGVRGALYAFSYSVDRWSWLTFNNQTQEKMVLACVAYCMPLDCIGGCVGLCMCLCLDKMGHSQHHDAHVHMLFCC